MARPAKSISTAVGARTKAEKDGRKAAENKLKGVKTPEPPEYLNEKQREVFNFIVDGLKEAQILGKLDTYVLAMTATAIERLEYLDTELMKPENVGNTKLMQAREKYSRDFFRGCNELSLSPQARAKLSIANVNAMMEAKKKNPLLEALND